MEQTEVILFVESKWLSIQHEGRTIYDGKKELTAPDIEFLLKQLGFKVTKQVEGA